MALSAALICGAAFFSPRISLAFAAVVFLVGLMLRNPVLLSLGLILIVCARGNASLEALHAPLPSSVSGLGQLMADPEPQMFGTQLLLSVDGRRYLATVPIQDSAVVRPMMMGEHVQVTGRVSELRGAPAGWVQARHLAGRLQLNSVKVGGTTAPWYQLANAVHSRVSAGADSFPEEQRSLYLGLVLGDDRGQSEILKFRFQASGLSHLLAVSGQNVAFLLAVAAPVLRRMPLRLQVFFGVLLLAMFAIVTRGEPSVLRAAVMAAIALSSVAAGRLASGLRVLSMTIIALVITDPLLVHSIGFQLSIAATAGLLVMARPLADRLPGPALFRLPLAVTLAAQVATAPVLVALAGGIPAVATPANLLAVPAAGLVMMLGVTVGLGAGLIRNPLAQLVQIPSELLVRWIGWVARRGSQSALPLLRPFQLLLLGVAGLLLLLLSSHRFAELAIPARFKQSLRLFARCLALSLLLIAIRPTHLAAGESDLTAGATLWVGTCGGQVLAVGPSANAGDLLESLWAAGVRRLDIVVAEPGSAATRTAQVVAQQFQVRRLLSVGERSPPGMTPIGMTTWSAGGAQVVALRDPARKQRRLAEPRVLLSASACSF